MGPIQLTAANDGRIQPVDFADLLIGIARCRRMARPRCRISLAGAGVTLALGAGRAA